jgi:nucleoside-diphosphate-sugar epimerase
MRIVINGARGWLGQASLNAIYEKFPLITESELTLLGREACTLKLNKRTHKISQIGKSGFHEETDIFIQLAFKTRDYIYKLGDVEYRRVNKELIQKSLLEVKRAKPKKVVLISSGVVTKYLESNFQTYTDAYTELKLLEEKMFQEVCLEIGAKLRIIRLWGATGYEMTEPLKYAIGDIIRQALTDKRILINSGNCIYRRYIDAFQLMTLAIMAEFKDDSEIFDSGGTIVEIGELAKSVCQELNIKEVIIRPIVHEALPDIYIPTGNVCELYAKELSIELHDLKKQIHLTTKAVTRALI